MDQSAQSHQKDSEKNCLCAAVYSEGSDSLRAHEHVVCWSHDSQTQPGSAQRPLTVGDLEPSRSKLRHQWEEQAHELMNQQPSPQALKNFLRQVPWQAFQMSLNTSREPERNLNPEQTKEPAYVIFGTYSHGGVVGITKVTRDYPWLSRAVMQMMRGLGGGERMTSVCVSCNVQSPPHRDVYNLENSRNTVVPLIRPRQGGELWVSGNQMSGEACRMQCGSDLLPGNKIKLNKTVHFDAKQWHATTPWVGDRIVLIGYSLNGAQKLQKDSRDLLRRRGFPLPYRMPYKTSLRPQPKASQEDSACYTTHRFPESLDVGRETLQERASEATPGAGGNPAGGLDQGTAGLSLGGVVRGGRDGPFRAGRSQDGEQVQDQGSSTGVTDGTLGVLHEAPELRSVEKLHAQVPHGEQGPRHGGQLHGVWEALPSDLRRDTGDDDSIHRVVRDHRCRGTGMSLEAQEVCKMGAKPWGQREAPDPEEDPNRTARTTSESPSSRLLHGAQRQFRDDQRTPLGDGQRHGDGPGREFRASNPDSRVGGGDEAAQGDDRQQQQEPHRRLHECPQKAEPRVRDLRDPEPEVIGSLSEIAEWDPQPGAMCPLPFRTARTLGNQYEESLMSSIQEFGFGKVVLVEIGASEQSRLVTECERVFGKGSAVHVSSWNGGDLETPEGRKYVRRLIEETCPQVVWFSPDTTPYSPAQKLNQRTPDQVLKVQAKRDRVNKQYEGLVEVFRAAHQSGHMCVLEMSDACEVWGQRWIQDLQKDFELYEGCCQGCQVNLRDYQGALVCNSWRLASTNGALVQTMALACDGKHRKGRSLGYEGLRGQGYTKEFCVRVVRFLQRLNSWTEIAKQVQFGTGLCLAADEEPFSSSGDPEDSPDDLRDIPADERKQIFQNLRRVHTATGHCSISYMRATLKRRGATRNVMRCLEQFSCDVCKERSRPDPRSQSSLVEIAPKWHTLQCDAFSWNHPETHEKWQFMLGIDEGSRLRTGRLLFQHGSRTPSAQDFIDYFEGHYLPHFGKPQLLRLDPAGCFRSKGLDAYLLDRQIEVHHIPAEAHWQISLVERAVQTVKSIMTALVLEQPQMTASEAFYRSLWASNHREQYHGYSPLQHAFGRAPDELGHLGESKMRDLPILTESGISAEFGPDVKAMLTAEKVFLEEQAKERLRRAALSGARAMRNFCPGDLVFAWRRMTPKQDGQKHFRGGRFVGPYRVLGTESRIGDQRKIEAGKVIWLYRGGQLVKAAPQQLRPATSREEAWSELQDPTPIPWTISETLQKQPPHQFEDVTADVELMPPDAEFQELEDHEMRPPPRRLTGKQSRPVETEDSRPTRSRSPVREKKEASGESPQEISGEPHRERSRSLPRRVSATPRRRPLEQADYLEDCGVVFPEEENVFWAGEQPAVTFSLDLPKVTTKQGKEWTRDMGCYFVKQLKRQAVEVSEKRLSEEELLGFRTAKQKEVKNFVVAQAFRALPQHLKPNRSQVMKMRWLLTWKLDDEPPPGEPLKRDASGNPLKPKARAVVLGYMDPEYEYRPTSSPTMGRSTRQMFLQNCANRKFTVEKGDISGAFLQGDDFGPERPMVCEPLPEICEALGVPAQTPMLLTKAAYGLVEAPIQWYLSVAKFLEGLGAERQLSDPACWGFFRKDRAPIGWVCGHVDDFMFGGDHQDPEWMEIRRQIQERFKWGQWESKKFTQCGVLIEQTSDGFLLSQPEYLNSVSEIHVGRSRHQDLTAEVTNHELLQLRSVLGALSWHATQVAPQWCAPVGMLLSRISKGTIQEIVDTNKLLRRAKLSQHHKMRIHGFPREETLLAAWADAADGHRPDGSSTKGVFIGWTTSQLLKGDLVAISPMFWQSAKIQRTCKSSGAAETRAAADTEDELYALRFQAFEFQGGQVSLWNCDQGVSEVPGVLISDSKNLFDRLNQTVLTLKGAEKRIDIETLCLKESMSSTSLKVRWVNGDSQLANSLTKENELHQLFEYLRREGQWRIVYDPTLLSGRKRKQLGFHSLDSAVAG